ncbi:SusD/RagB family nutrient-binding outer membrane lipoprotein [Polaribacter undariae]|uniref:SusD/RagB family nutrient-binding outer membrane lipoprotein n=1 Tax=Polaribacter sejongensis TaxID=985043 RepID=A0AAJ1QXC0_9FLAO|nr:SusD/RagB family nutrient-binding outer membrane lipoprotein [Polaribacter undariae]MDN3619926.1 SusD/RagB family nutrient-binding outer membrane lipoprotein [Polaribacter undariae]UWD33862.1 SusD/RagB family nutrient-binding outer membrane lipoprotein [Polaribacter undariae]
MGNTETHYNAAISASIIYWGGTQAEADTYLAQTTVAYTTSGSSWKEVIGNQKYIALYGRGFEAWTSWRLLDYPNTFTRPSISNEAIPRRYLYGYDDKDLNPDNYAAASSAMGGDDKSSRVFWDIAGVGNKKTY